MAGVTEKAMAISALGVCGLAWLVTAVVLSLDLLGRPLVKCRCDVRVRRRELIAGLAMMTVVVLVQLAELDNWPRPLRESLDLLVVLVALVALVCVVAGLPSRPGKSQQP
jgi:hypothetical protein